MAAVVRRLYCQGKRLFAMCYFSTVFNFRWDSSKFASAIAKITASEMLIYFHLERRAERYSSPGMFGLKTSVLNVYKTMLSWLMALPSVFPTKKSNLNKSLYAKRTKGKDIKKSDIKWPCRVICAKCGLPAAGSIFSWTVCGNTIGNFFQCHNICSAKVIRGFIAFKVSGKRKNNK